MATDEWPRGVEYAESYERTLGEVTFDRWPSKLLERVPVSPGDRVLDVCCGTGVVARHVAPLVDPGQVIGVDASEDMISVARRVVGDAVDWRLGDAAHLPLEDASVDVVFCSHGLQHVAERLGALRDWLRVVRPGGRLGLAQWGDQETALPCQWAVRTASEDLGWPNPGSGAPPGELGDPTRLRRLVEEAGWQEVEIVTEQAVAPPTPLDDLLARALRRLAEPWAEASDVERRRWRSTVEATLRPHRVADGRYAVPYTAHVLTAARVT